MAEESNPIKDAIGTTKEIAGKSVPDAQKVDGEIPLSHNVKDAVDTIVETTKDIAGKASPVLEKAGYAIKNFAGKAADVAVNTAEKVTHSDLNQDGKIGGEDEGPKA